MDDAFLPTHAAAQYLGISAKTLLRAVRRGALAPAHRTPGGHLRFGRVALDAYARARASGTAPSPAPSDTWIEEFLAALAQPAWVYDHQTLRFLLVNDAAVRHYGYTRAEFLALRITAIRPAMDVEPLLDAVQRARTPDDGFTARPWRHLTKDGRLRDVVISARALTYARRPASMVIVRDITAPLDAARGEERFRALFKAMPLPTYAWRQSGDDWILADYNDAAIAITEGGIAALVGQSARILYADHPLMLEEFARCARGGVPIHREMPWRFISTGREAVLVVSYVPVPPDLVLVQTEDVTPRKRAEAARRQAEDELRRSERLFRAQWEHTNDSVIILDVDGSCRYVSPSHLRLLGRTPEDLMGVAATAHIHPDDLEWAGPRLAAVLHTPGATDIVVVRFRHSDGSWRWLESAAVNHRDDPAVGGTIIYSRDVTAHKAAEDALRASEERFQALAEHASDLVTLLDHDGTIRYASPSHLPLLGYTPADLEGTDAFARIHPEDAARIHGLFTRNMCEGGTGARYEMRYRHADGSWRTLEAAGVNRLDDPAVRGFIVNSRDITERKQAEDALAHQALHDGLTGLPNRTLLTDRLERALLTAERGQAPVALLLLDLDRFKEVNDTFGHHHGDLLLWEVTQRLGRLVRETDTVARLGGDEFAVVLPEADAAGAVRVAHQIIDALDTPFGLDAHTMHVGVSVGIAIYPTHGSDAATLMRLADVAMYLAKRTQSGYAVYDAAQDQHSPRRIALVTALRRAIPAGDLTLHYQPQLALVNGPPGAHDHVPRRNRRRLVGVEALVRWQHPERGLIPPDEFIPLAEGTGLIKGLTERVLALALSQCRAWRRAGLLLPVAVNLSAWNLRDPRLVQTVAELLQAHDVPPAWLRLEMTESAIMADTERAVVVLSQLVALGVRVSVDDYGTGYSSLAYLKRLPVDELKIDKSFVRDMARDETDAAIVRSTVGLAHTLGLRAVAEGVEDEVTWARLAAMDCDVAQGYFISRPVTADALARWLHATGEMAADVGGVADGAS